MDNNSIGPIASSQHYLDFTLLFEDAILIALPAAVFLCIFPPRLYWLLQQPRKVVAGRDAVDSKNTGHIRYRSKLIVLCVFTALQATILALLMASRHVPTTRASAAAAILSLVGAVALCLLSCVEHTHSVRPSPVIDTYLLLSLMVDIIRVRTVWMRRGFPSSLAIVYSISITARLVLLLLEACEKRSILLDRYRAWSPETTSGVYGRRLFCWLNPLLQGGSRKILGMADMLPLDASMGTDTSYLSLEQVWATKSESDKAKPHALLFTLLWHLRWSLAQAMIPRLCVTFFQYMQPFLITAVIAYLQKGSASDKSPGWALTAAYGIDYVGLAVVNSFWMHMAYRTVILARGGLVSMIYSHTLDLEVKSLDDSAAITLMSADMERIGVAFTYIHGLWASPVDMFVGLYLLERRIGVACIGPALLSVTFGSIVLFVAMRFALQAQRVWVRCIQTRIHATARILGAMKVVKMLGLTTMVTRLLQGLREEETRMALRFRRISVMRLSLGKGSEILAPGIAFAAYTAVCAATGQTLDVAKAYSSLNIVSIMTVQLGETIQNLPTIFSAIGCMDRIQDFLNLPGKDVAHFHKGRPAFAVSTVDDFGETNKLHGDVALKSLPRRIGKSEAASAPMLRVESASFTWTGESNILSDLSFSVEQGSFVSIVGPVGSGKSTLLKGLMGEVRLVKGVVHNDNLTAGFVAQSSWLQNGTIQSNIIGMSPFVLDWYAVVIHACCLNEDIALLPNGSNTKVGSGGIKLSGGQKQRVALARAVYSKHSLLLLDDCFSGLDATTEERIFIRLLGKEGLLRELGSTVLLVTHAAHRLSGADNIIVLDDSGRLAEQGSFDFLAQHGSYLPGLTADLEGSGAEEAPLPYDRIAQAGPSKPIVFSKSDMVEYDEDTDAARALKDPKRSAGDWSTYANYFKSCGWENVAGVVLGLAGFAVFMKIPDVWITFWTRAIQAKGNSVNGYYLGILLMFEFISLFCLICTGCLVFLRMTPSASLRQHRKVLDTVMAAPLVFFSIADTGETLNRFSQDMNLIDIELPPASLELLAQVFLSTVQAILVCLSAGYFAASIPFVLVIIYYLQKFYLRTSRQLRLLEIEAKSPLFTNFVETLEGLVTIRIFGWENKLRQHNANLLEESQKPFYLLNSVQRWLSLVLDMTIAGLTILLLILFVSLPPGTITPGLAGVALVNLNGFSSSLTLLIKAWTMLETSMGAIARVQSFTTQTVSEHQFHETQPLPAEWPPHGGIHFRSLTASYQPDKPILRDLDLKILPGQKIAICGPSGSGKSTIISTLFRLLDISHGQILIDDTDITSVSREQLRTLLNAIPQESFLFPGTIRENLDPLGRCTDADRVTALQKVGLWSIVEKKAGLDTVADSELFSHGQWQLFGLARAILHPSRIVVLDEVTASVDQNTEEVMQRIIRKEFADRTIVAVAHRLDTVMDFDKIAMMVAGKLVEFASPEELMSKDTAFRAMYESRR